jgi:catechol 2,3-dioxygenase-like lactoylglutathione lyase family enzyme
MKEVRGGVRIVTFTVKDLAATRAFYVDRLGLLVDREEPGRFIQLNMGTFRLCLDKEGHDNPGRGGGANLIFKVTSLENAAKELMDLEIPFERKKGTRVGEFLEVKDPEGYVITFSSVI